MNNQFPMKTLTYLLVLVFCLASGACLGDYPMRVKDARGKTVLVKARPARIVSLAPGNTEILYAIGLADRVVGVTRLCNYPAAAKKKPKIGDMTVDVEAVVALKPDLVFAHSALNSSVILKLERLGLTVFSIDPKTLGEVCRDIRSVGKITSRPKTADSVAGKIESAVKAVKAESAKKTACKVLVVIQSNPLWAAGPKTFVNEMLGTANADNIAFDARPGFVPFSRESAISRNPDVIITGLKSDVEFFSRSPEWRSTGAVKSKRIYVVNSDILLRAGPRLADGLREIGRRL